MLVVRDSTQPVKVNNINNGRQSICGASVLLASKSEFTQKFVTLDAVQPNRHGVRGDFPVERFFDV